MTARNNKWGLPASVVGIVVSHVADYDRRKACITRGGYSESVLDYYRKLNSVIDCSLAIVEEALRNDLFEDIKTGRGYSFSPASSIICKNGYYARKRKVLRLIAEGLNLV